jgi:hypothetical protein
MEGNYYGSCVEVVGVGRVTSCDITVGRIIIKSTRVVK